MIFQVKRDHLAHQVVMCSSFAIQEQGSWQQAFVASVIDHPVVIYILRSVGSLLLPDLFERFFQSWVVVGFGLNKFLLN